MARLTYNKASLHQQIRLLKRYRQFLPSLDLKRKQLLQERAKAKAELLEWQNQIEQQLQWIEQELPMLANQYIAVDGLVKIEQLETTEENVVGITLPVFSAVTFTTPRYSYFCKPHWVDGYVSKMQLVVTIRLQRHIGELRLDKLDQALKKVTQRVNLFEKVLIPRAIENIRKIRIYLSDNERAAVIRSKITKQKRVG
jgi:V/A-type H+-transporting ATPase subunit D